MNTDIEKQFEVIKNGELLKEQDIRNICAKVREIFIEEGNVQRIDTPVTICGDIHGQFYDLTELFKIGGQCPDVNYLFLGDYVNRGHHSIETIMLLFSLKIKFPDRITLLRGNHESRIITQVYGLYDESLRKYGSVNVWRYITDIFEYMTISALVDDKIFCVHGGLAEGIKSLDDIRTMDRVREIPQDGEMCELLWNDPEEEQNGFKESPRGCGKMFGNDILKEFLQTNNLSKVVRAHQLVMEGNRPIWDSSLITVWSAPNYCYRCGNVASFMQVEEKQKLTFKNFDAVQDQLKGASQKVATSVPDYFL